MDSKHQELKQNTDQLKQKKEEPEVHTQPYYVNAKQYLRIVKRRHSRGKLEEILAKIKEYEHRTVDNEKKYLHESRHKHAMKRARGPGGRFLTAQEQEKQ